MEYKLSGYFWVKSSVANTTKVVCMLVLVFLVGTEPATAQNKQNTLLGDWEGALVLQVDGKEVESRLHVAFLQNGKVKLTSDGRSDNGSYQSRDGRIVISFQDNSLESITLRNITLTANSLSASVEYGSDPPDAASSLILNRTNVLRSRTLAKPQDCSRFSDSAELMKVFEKYQVTCPIDVISLARWPNQRFFSQFLQELIAKISKARNDALLSFDFFRTRDEPDKVVMSVRSTVGDDERIDWNSIYNVLSILNRVLKEKQQLSLFPQEHLKQMSVNSVLYFTQLQPRFLVGSQINYDTVWSEILSIGARMGIRFDSKNEKVEQKTRTIRESSLRKVGEQEGFHYFEKVTVTQRVPYESVVTVVSSLETGKHVAIEVVSEVFKRKGYSSYRQSVNCELTTVATRRRSVCSEGPFFWEIMQALVKP